MDPISKNIIQRAILDWLWCSSPNTTDQSTSSCDWIQIYLPLALMWKTKKWLHKCTYIPHQLAWSSQKFGAAVKNNFTLEKYKNPAATCWLDMSLVNMSLCECRGEVCTGNVCKRRQKEIQCRSCCTCYCIPKCHPLSFKLCCTVLFDQVALATESLEVWHMVIKLPSYCESTIIYLTLY